MSRIFEKILFQHRKFVQLFEIFVVTNIDALFKNFRQKACRVVVTSAKEIDFLWAKFNQRRNQAFFWKFFIWFFQIVGFDWIAGFVFENTDFIFTNFQIVNQKFEQVKKSFVADEIVAIFICKCDKLRPLFSQWFELEIIKRVQIQIFVEFQIFADKIKICFFVIR